jgi:hypothetical protein
MMGFLRLMQLNGGWLRGLRVYAAGFQHVCFVADVTAGVGGGREGVRMLIGSSPALSW